MPKMMTNVEFGVFYATLEEIAVQNFQPATRSRAIPT